MADKAKTIEQLKAEFVERDEALMNDTAACARGEHVWWGGRVKEALPTLRYGAARISRKGE